MCVRRGFPGSGRRACRGDAGKVIRLPQQNPDTSARRSRADKSTRSPVRRYARHLLILALGVAALSAYIVSLAASATVVRRREGHFLTSWTRCNANARNTQPSSFAPLSDAAAAALVTREPETRGYNARPYIAAGKTFAATNNYVPTAAQLRRFRGARTSAGQTVAQLNPYFRYVDGLDGLRAPSTDDLIQWAAHKWGIPEDWLRAEYVQESYWNAFQRGDEALVSSSWYQRYPVQARIPDRLDVDQSLGITQVKWLPDGSVGAGTEPLRWESTAFNVDYQAAMVRFYYDNPGGTRAAWGDSTYAPCQAWRSIGGWYEPYPWANSGQERYIAAVQQQLRNREWVAATFVDWTPTVFPPGIRFR